MGAIQWIISIIILASLPFIAPLLFFVAFYASPESYTLNYIGRVLLGIYALIYFVTGYLMFKSVILHITKTHKNS